MKNVIYRKGRAFAGAVEAAFSFHDSLAALLLHDYLH